MHESHKVYKDFTIKPKKIENSWSGEATYTYNGDKQGPTLVVESQDPIIAGDDVDPHELYADEFGVESTEMPKAAGTYIMTASELSDPYNYTLVVLDPETNLPAEENVAQYDPIYTIHQYKIQKIDWSGYEVIYNASNQLPAAKVGDLQGPDTEEECRLILTNEDCAEDYKGECNAGDSYKVYILDKDGIRNMNYIFDDEKMEEENYGWHQFIIKKRPLVITAKPKTITYTYSYAKYGKYGTYQIIPGKAGAVTSDNYDVRFANGRLTVKDKVAKLVAKATAKGKKAATIKWNKVTGAKKYVLYWAKCSKNEKKYKCKKFKTVSASKTQYIKKKLKKNFKYKFYVAALDASGKQIAKSHEGHFTTGNVSGKFTNPKKLKVSTKTVNLTVGKTYKIKSTIKKVKKNKKLFKKTHTDKLRYMSYHPDVATVSKSGVITARSKGFCRVYVQAVNGMWQIITVNVK